MRKSFLFDDFEFKADPKKGQPHFTGYGSIYGTPDQWDEIVVNEAFADDLVQRGNTRPLLLDHEMRLTSRAGTIKVEENSKGLWVEAFLNLKVPAGAEAIEHLRHISEFGDNLGMSIGYQTLKDEMIGGFRHLQKMKLREVSLTQFPMHEDAGVDMASVKSLLTKGTLSDEEMLKVLRKALRIEPDQEIADIEPADAPQFSSPFLSKMAELSARFNKTAQ